MDKVSLETRIASLEDQILQMHSFYMVLLNLIFRYDDRLRLTAIEAIRRILQNPIPTHSFEPRRYNSYCNRYETICLRPQILQLLQHCLNLLFVQ